MLFNKIYFLASVFIGILFWVIFIWINIEPWDSLYGWITVVILGFVFGFVGKVKPWLWPLGLFLGELLFGIGGYLKDLFFYSGGGVNMFIPLGILFLVPFTIPAFIGSFVGYGARKAIKQLNKALKNDAQNTRVF